MARWPLITAISALMLGGAAIVYAQTTAGDGSSSGAPHGQQERDLAASEEAMAARAAIADDPIAPKLEPADYDVTVVFYTDYQCPFCRKVHPELNRLAEEDGRVRVVYRDLPLFGSASEESARAAIASQWQGKHAEFNDALMQTQGKLDSDKIRAAADRAGVDWTQLQRDLEARRSEIDELIGRTKMQAAKMGLQGTPALLIGPYMVPGAINFEGLTEAVALAREFNAETKGG